MTSLKLICCFLLAFVIFESQAKSTFYPSKTGTIPKFFWYPTDQGTFVPAFLEGAPRAARANDDDVKFYLYTKDNPSNPDLLVPNCDSCLENSHFDRNAPLKILCHGFSSSHDGGFGAGIKNGYMTRSTNYNVISINWSVLSAAPWYETAAANTDFVGRYVSRLVQYLVSKGVTSLDRVHFIGHSLGAHVGGIYGFASTIGKPARITGLDPALPLFGNIPLAERLDESDAQFVDVVHTAGGTLADGGLGFTDPLGHVDFYPNGGRPSMPGCGIDLAGSCSHSRAHEFYSESTAHPENFRACKCNSWEEFHSGVCTCQTTDFMGDRASGRGLFYLRTNANSPYGQG